MNFYRIIVKERKKPMYRRAATGADAAGFVRSYLEQAWGTDDVKIVGVSRCSEAEYRRATGVAR